MYRQREIETVSVRAEFTSSLAHSEEFFEGAFTDTMLEPHFNLELFCMSKK